MNLAETFRKMRELGMRSAPLPPRDDPNDPVRAFRRKPVHIHYPKYSGLGMYPLYYILDDNGIVCAYCASTECRIGGTADGFRLEAVGTHWEGDDIFCNICGEAIESAYGEVEEAS